MKPAGVSLSETAAARLRAWSERRLTAEAVRTQLDWPISEEERAEVLALIRWFRRRYREPADRLAYARRAYARWHRSPISRTA